MRIRKSSKTYLIRKSIGGKQQVISLGKSPKLSLKQAKVEAASYLLSQDVSNVTVRQITDKYYKKFIEPSSKVPKQVKGYLNKITEEFGDKKVISITTVSLASFIENYCENHGKRTS